MRGPRKLGSILGAWNVKDALGRKASGGDQAAHALWAAWEDAVGPQIAGRSRPTKLVAGVLTVLTPSSAWSDELTFLAPKIVEALRRAVPEAQLRRLRFMVASGRTKALLEGARLRERSAPAKASHDVHPVAAGEKRADAHEDARATVARLVRLQGALDEWRDRAGWKRCAACQRRFVPERESDGLCAPCAGAARQRDEARIERALMQAPWLSLIQLRQSLSDVKAAAYQRTRRRLLTRWQFEIAAAERRLRRGALTAQDRVAAWSYLMLLTGMPERDIGRAAARDVLGQPWTSALFDHSLAPIEEARATRREKHA